MFYSSMDGFRGESYFTTYRRGRLLVIVNPKVPTPLRRDAVMVMDDDLTADCPERR